MSVTGLQAHILKYKKLYLNPSWKREEKRKATLPEKGCPVKCGVANLQIPLDTALSKLLQLTLSGVRDWDSWISDVGGAFQPQIWHNFKLQLGNTGVILLVGDLCKPYLAFLSRFQYFQHRKKKYYWTNAGNKYRKPHCLLTPIAK